MRTAGVCHHLLEEPTDAYEWSFVAVPAQPGAGVRKTLKSTQGREDIRAGLVELLTRLDEVLEQQEDPEPEEKQEKSASDRELEALIRSSRRLLEETERSMER